MSDDVSERQLLARLVPDPKMGDLVAFLATTYELDPDFFDGDWLPTVAGLKAHGDRSRRGRVELELALAGAEAAVVLVDAQEYRARPRSLRVEVCPGLGEARRKLHAKISVLVYDQAVRMTIGSANLTHFGYRENREIVSVWTATPDDTRDAVAIRTVLDELPDALREWWGSARSADRVLNAARERLRAWPRSDDDTETLPVLSGRGTPLWQRVLDRWGSTPLTSVHIASPFWSSETWQHRAFGKLVDELDTRALLGPGTRIELRCEVDVTPDRRRLPIVKPGVLAVKLPPGVQGDARPVDGGVLPEEVEGRTDYEGSRKLHAKVVVLSDGRRALAYAGSANFTAYGWGFHSTRRHAEAGVLVEGSPRQLLALLPPLDPMGQAIPLGSGEHAAAPDDDEDHGLPWPAFLRGLWLRRNGDRYELHLDADVSAAEHGAWTLLLPPEDGATTLLEHRAGSPISSDVALTTSMVARLLTERHVLFREAGNDDLRAVPLNIDVALRETLPMTSGGADPREEQLLAFYLGRMAIEDALDDGQTGTGWFDEDDEPPQQRLGGVDTSGIQTYQMRLFVDALPGIRSELARAARSPSSMRIALVGPVSPTALAREIAVHPTRSSAAKGFQLVEILACLDEAARLDVRADLRPKWLDALEDARSTVQRALDGLSQVDPSFQTYRARVLGRAAGTT